jgi:TonB family protein
MITLWMLAATAFTLLLGVAALAGERVQRSRLGAARGVWLGALIAAVLWPVLVPVLRAPAQPTPVAVRTWADGTDAVTSDLTAEHAAPWWSAARRALAERGAQVAHLAQRAESTALRVALLVAWAMMSLLLLARLMRAAIQLRTVTRSGTPAVVDGEPVLLSTSFGPATVGWRTPRIVLPSWVPTLDAPLRALVLAHERAHRDARDPRLLWAAALATALVPWNVGVWWIARRLRLAVELDCDARTLAALPGSPVVAQRVYARLLLFMAQHVPVTPAPQRFAFTRLASAMASSRSHLATRIRRMPQLIQNPASPRARRQRLLFGGVALLAVAAACGTHIPGNLTAVAPVNARAPEVTTTPSPEQTSDAPPPPTSNTAADRPYFEFQVEQPATMQGPANLQYPALLRSAQIEGTVLASFVVDTDGRVDPATFKVLKSDHELFSNAVRNALARMHYEPGRLDGRAVRQLVQQPFVFALAASADAPSPRAADGRVAVTAVMPDAQTRREGAPYFEFQVDKPAAVRTNAGMTYPPALRAARVEGTVLAAFVVDEQGVADMSTFKVLRSDHEAFTDAVQEALPRMSYLPAEVNGTRVKQLVQQPFVFNLAK